MTTITARRALTAEGWRRDVAIEIAAGRIVSIRAAPASAAADVDVLVPAPGNLHSHAFQRAMAGLTEARGTGRDDFWSWRSLMYRFLERLDPDDVEAIAAGVQLEMLEAGYAAVGEFHYLHNGPDGTPYADRAELSAAVVRAAKASGIGLTLLPVLYMQGGLDGRPLEGGQRRFANTLDSFAALLAGAARAVATLPDDARLGVAPHSLRAVPLAALGELGPFPSPRHIHVAEQTAEVEAVRAATGLPPVARLMECVGLGPDWTLIHATHAGADEIEAVARAGAVVGLCPITEANLGDGIFDAAALTAAGGRFGIGSDSNVRISLTEELRTLDYGQRLARRVRNPFATPERSSGRVLWESACRGAAQALARGAGVIAPGEVADLVALDGAHRVLQALDGDRLLDAAIFAGDDGIVRHVWSAGRPMVRDGRHVARETIVPAFERTLRKLRAGV